MNEFNVCATNSTRGCCCLDQLTLVSMLLCKHDEVGVRK
jgi:hypothetical protein